MTLQEWLDEWGRGGITELHHRTRVSTKTITAVAKGLANTRLIAEALSEGTNGEVSVATLLGVDVAGQA